MKQKVYLKSLVVRILICIILFLSISIFVRSSDKNLLLYKNNIYDKTINFSKITNWYNKRFGKVLPIDDAAISVNKSINYKEASKYKDGVSLSDVDVVYPFKSGIVVFTGDKDDYGSTVIVQGMDGIDYWYSNIENVNVKLYDYVESDNIIGNPINDNLYCLFMKDGKILNYEEYI